ncbi:hypothetical protein C8J57DRAFT_1229613 [Mycena rebaudengoi]|nr:hypothetical protein C8J57DRAFT_1229613 [Mycena rebaudengoi]
MHGLNKRVVAACAIAALTTLSLGAWSTIQVGPEVIIKSDFPGCHIAIVKPQLCPGVEGTCPRGLRLICDIVILGFTLRRTYTYPGWDPVFSCQPWSAMCDTRGGLFWVCIAILATKGPQ